MDELRRSLPPLSSLLPFEAAARHLNFTRAAGELKLTQTAVSRQIRALEDDLGVRLFERRNRAVFLTDAGADLAAAVAAGLERIAAAAAGLRGQPGQVVLSVELYLAVYWLMPRLSEFHRVHPNVDLRVVAARRPLAASRERFDLALQCSGRPSGPHPQVHAAAEEIFPVCSPAHLAGRAGPLALDELEGERLLHFADEAGEWMGWDDWMTALGQAPLSAARTTVFDSYPVLIQAALAGHGVALGWGRGLEGLLADGSLVACCRERLHLPQGLKIFRRLGTGIRPESQALLVWLKRVVGEPG